MNWFRARLFVPALTVVLAASLAGACGGPTFIIQQYEGDVRPRDTIGIVRINGKETVQIVTLDGELVGTNVPEDARLHIEVLPGVHSLTIRDLAHPDYPALRVSFTAEANRVYRPVIERAQPGSVGALGFPLIGRIYEVSRDADAKVRDVTARMPVPAADAAPTRPPAALPPATILAPEQGDAVPSNGGVAPAPTPVAPAATAPGANAAP